MRDKDTNVWTVDISFDLQDDRNNECAVIVISSPSTEFVNKHSKRLQRKSEYPRKQFTEE
jgi:deoxyinosine 3'endonuclease (endonuclease V)